MDSLQAKFTLQEDGVTAIRVEKLHKSYGSRVALAGIDLEIPKGALFGFIGPNGAGKTTTIRLLLGMLRPNGGRASVFGLDCWTEAKAIKRRAGYLPGDLVLPGWLSGADALRMLSLAHGRDLSAHGRALAERFELSLEVPVRDMSRGMRQKLGLIMAMAHQPPLLILDEPTTALDPLTQERLADLLRELARDDATIFFSSHVLSEVADLCERVAIIRQGRIVAHERLADLRNRAARHVTIRWRADGQVPADPPEFLDVLRREDCAWQAALSAPVPDFLAWLHGQPVDDLIVEPPDLDRLFRSYYQEDEPETASGAQGGRS